MKRTVITRRHNGPTELVAYPERACTLEAPFNPAWIVEVGKPYNIDTPDFQGVLYLRHMEPFMSGDELMYRYHFAEAATSSP